MEILIKFNPSVKVMLAWLFRLGTEPMRVHWCSLVEWYVA